MNLPEEMWLNLPKDLTNKKLSFEIRLKAFHYYYKILMNKIDAEQKKEWNKFIFVQKKQLEIRECCRDLLNQQKQIEKDLELIKKDWIRWS